MKNEGTLFRQPLRNQYSSSFSGKTTEPCIFVIQNFSPDSNDANLFNELSKSKYLRLTCNKKTDNTKKKVNSRECQTEIQ